MFSKQKLLFSVFLLSFLGCKQEDLKVSNFGSKKFEVSDMLFRDSFVDFRVSSNFKIFSGKIYFLDVASGIIKDSSLFNNTKNEQSFIHTINMNNSTYFSAPEVMCVFRVADFDGKFYQDTTTNENPFSRGARTKKFKSILGLLAYWPLESDVKDYSGNNQHATTTNGNIIFKKTPNQKFDAAYFNGNSSLNVPHSNNLNPNTFTISSYITPTTINDNTNANYSVIIGKREGDGWGNGFEYGIGKLDNVNYIVAATWTNSGNGGIQSPKAFSFGTSTHFIYTHDKDSAKLFVNGKILIAQKSNGVINNGNTLPITIGRRGNGYHPFTGYINDVAVWDRVLNKKEIEDISNMFK
jgi:hypothetical protein